MTLYGPDGRRIGTMPQPRCCHWPSCRYFGLEPAITGPYVKYTDQTYAHAICNEHYAEQLARKRTGKSDGWYNRDWYQGGTPDERHGL